LGLSPLAVHTGMGRQDKAHVPAGHRRQSVVSQVECASGNGSLRLMEKCCIMCPSCFVAFQPLGSLCSSPHPKRLSPLELDKEGIDVNLEYLDDVSVFSCDFDDDVLDHGNTGSDDDFDDDEDDDDDART
jgi:hypothetical protein